MVSSQLLLLFLDTNLTKLITEVTVQRYCTQHALNLSAGLSF